MQNRDRIMTAIVPQQLRVDGLLVRFARGGKATGTPVLLTSPWPESIFAFGEIWSTLADVAPLVALDLPGFGKSESRPGILNRRAMGEFLARFIDELQLDRPHAVCPDVGTAASLYAASTRNDLFTSLTVGGGGMDESLVASTLKQIIEAPDTSAFEAIDGADIVAGSITWQIAAKSTGEDATSLTNSGAFEGTIDISNKKSSVQPLLDIGATEASVKVYGDGTALIAYRGKAMELSREFGRYILRRAFQVYESGMFIASLWEAFREDVKCERPDCRQLIPAARRLAALERDQPAKCCSIRCQRTEATRRYSRKHRL